MKRKKTLLHDVLTLYSAVQTSRVKSRHNMACLMRNTVQRNSGSCRYIFSSRNPRQKTRHIGTFGIAWSIGTTYRSQGSGSFTKNSGIFRCGCRKIFDMMKNRIALAESPLSFRYRKRNFTVQKNISRIVTKSGGSSVIAGVNSEKAGDIVHYSSSCFAGSAVAPESINPRLRAILFRIPLTKPVEFSSSYFLAISIASLITTFTGTSEQVIS